MKNAAPANRRKRSMRAVSSAIAATLCTAFMCLPAASEDAEHWLVPSHHRVDSGTLYESGFANGPASRTPVSSKVLLREGAALYGTHCSSCHGADLAGTRGVPSLKAAGGAATDFYMTTGRMPLAVRGRSVAAGEPVGAIMASGTQAYHQAQLFNDRQIAALDAYVTQHAAHVIPIPIVQVDVAKLQHGRKLFEDNCEACHGAGAQGATAGYQWTALPLKLATPTQIGEAIRVGPGVMPRFSAAQLSDRDVNAVATYVRYLVTEPQDYGGTVMGYVGPAAEGAVGAFLGVGTLFWVVFFTGTKSDGRRLHELDDRKAD